MGLIMDEKVIRLLRLQGDKISRYAATRIEKLEAQVEVLQAIVNNLCEQQERQLDMEEAGHRCSYPSKFPEWEQAWEAAQAVRWGVE